MQDKRRDDPPRHPRQIPGEFQTPEEKVRRAEERPGYNPDRTVPGEPAVQAPPAREGGAVFTAETDDIGPV